MRACCNDITKRYRTPQEMLDDLELLSNDGKKYVVDPFATADANIHLSESDMEIYIKDYSDKTPSPDSVSSKKRSGLIINMSSSSDSALSDKKVSHSAKSASRLSGSLKINMSGSSALSLSDKKVSDSDMEKATSKDKKLADSGIKSSGSRIIATGGLRINMAGSSTPIKKEITKEKNTPADTKVEDKKKSDSRTSFFSKPKSL